MLRQDGGDGHGNSDKAILIHADPDNVEPGKTALRGAPRASLSAAALGKPVDRQDPRRDGAHIPKEFLLRVQVGRTVVT